jgi:hypothetical protein
VAIHYFYNYFIGNMPLKRLMHCIRRFVFQRQMQPLTVVDFYRLRHHFPCLNDVCRADYQQLVL